MSDQAVIDLFDDFLLELNEIRCEFCDKCRDTVSCDATDCAFKKLDHRSRILLIEIIEARRHRMKHIVGPQDMTVH